MLTLAANDSVIVRALNFNESLYYQAFLGMENKIFINIL